MGRVSAYFLEYEQVNISIRLQLNPCLRSLLHILRQQRYSHGMLSFCGGMVWDTFWDDPEMLVLVAFKGECWNSETLDILEWLQTQICFLYPSLSPEGISQLLLHFVYFYPLYLSYSVCLSCPCAFYPCARGRTAQSFTQLVLSWGFFLKFRFSAFLPGEHFTS